MYSSPNMIRAIKSSSVKYKYIIMQSINNCVLQVTGFGSLFSHHQPLKNELYNMPLSRKYQNSRTIKIKN